MGYRLRRNETVQKGVRRIGREQIDKAIREIDDPEIDRQKAIHQVRKRCKKLRALVRLVRPELGKAYKRENVRFRDIARNLAGMRDEQAMVEAFDHLLLTVEEDERTTLTPVLDELKTRRDATAASNQQDPDLLLARARQELQKARKAIGGWRLDTDGFQAVRGFNKTYKRGRKAARHAFETSAAGDFHQWRKRVKYHSNHLQLLGPLWPQVNKAWRRESKALGNILGDDHDLSLLDALLESEGKRLATARTRRRLQAIIQQEQQRLRGEAWQIGQRVYAEKPKATRKRWKCYCHAWQTPTG